jgi:serine/threonine protein kinase
MKQTLERVGKYEIIKEIARGSMGRVFLGFDPFINRRVAIKIPQKGRDDENFSRRMEKMFFNETRIAGSLDHPNILKVYDAGFDGNRYYLVMEYVEGGATLKDYCKKENLLPVGDVVRIIYTCCHALNYAHKHNVIHRDIKPSNILLMNKMDVKIGDFGIAQSIKSDTTQLIGPIGSPRYMSPEQVRDELLTYQTDIFSLGVVFYELLAGAPPFDAENISSLTFKIVHEEPKPLGFYRTDLPDGVEGIIQKSLAKRLEDRYPTGLDFAEDLGRLFDTLDFHKKRLDHEQKISTLKKLDFFRGFYESELWEILEASNWIEYGPSEKIIQEGDVDNSFYIIISGRVAVMKEKKKLVNLEEGNCFGEMGFIAHARRTASIITETPVTLLHVRESLMDKASLNCQLRFNKVFLRTLIDRLASTSKELLQRYENGNVAD